MRINILATLEIFLQYYYLVWNN